LPEKYHRRVFKPENNPPVAFSPEKSQRAARTPLGLVITYIFLLRMSFYNILLSFRLDKPPGEL
jgi:hypothetical protein